jgi:uncharacterized membrane protein
VRWRPAGLRVRGLDLAGVALAAAFFCLSLTPSLLPRPWYLQGAISGILTATGYLVGVFGASLGRRAVHWRPTAETRTLAWRVCLATSAVFALAFLYQSAMWQREIYQLMGMAPPPGSGYFGVPLLAAVIFTALLTVARLLRAVVRVVGRFFGRWIPPAAARAAATVGVVALVLALAQGLVANVLIAGANNSFKSFNGEITPGAGPPHAFQVSGSPGSLVPWASLGRYGRDFVVGGPSPQRLQQFSGRPALQPVRVYVGLDSAELLRDRAELAVRELERTGGFSRKVLCVITTTGTGWVDRHSVDPLEYMYNGDSALVALQYSYLPSWLSFIVDRDRAKAAGRELFNQVYARWSLVPARQRPKLLVFGESLGAFGAESAFSGVDDLRNRTDGGLFVGPPNSSTLWRDFVAARDRGTGEALPTFGDGETVRFAASSADLDRELPGWKAPRVLYLQHASDPVVWWSPRLILNRPDWLREERGGDVLPTMRWYPFVTFWQLTADLVYSIEVPAGHGHDYGNEQVDAWAQLAPPPGWTEARTAALKVALSAGP